jgi:hypothetical protein
LDSNKERIYRNWKNSGRTFYNIDKSNEATDEERKIILERFNEEQQQQQKKYTITEKDATGKETKYLVTENKPPQPQPQAVEGLYKKTVAVAAEPKPQTKLDKELEQSKKKWEQYCKDNQGKIPANFPKTIFDNFSSSSNSKNEVRKFKQLLEGSY